MYEFITSFIIHHTKGFYQLCQHLFWRAPLNGCFQLLYHRIIWDRLNIFIGLVLGYMQHNHDVHNHDFIEAGGVLTKKGRKHFEWKDMFRTFPYSLVVHITISRSSHWRYSVKKGIFKNFANFTRRHYLCWSLFNKVAEFRPATLIKRDFSTGVFLWNKPNFIEPLFWRTSTKDRFCIAYILCMHTLMYS